MSGYKFLMRYYQNGDDMYFFGFSRGSYIARFLAEMLDHVGLLSAGNEELIRFVWKTFAKWQERQGGSSAEEKKEAAEMLRFMKAFRETFSRPVRRIRFLGLFDTVNSVSKVCNLTLHLITIVMNRADPSSLRGPGCRGPRNSPTLPEARP
jgi:uncharacterized protein (DUF2235 family)